MSVDTNKDFLKISKLIKMIKFNDFNLSFNQLVNKMNNLN